MPEPTRDTAAGRAYNDLRSLAKRTGKQTDALMLEYVLERFLYRLSVSSQRSFFVLKGGLLLAQLGERRMTRDIDILGRGFPGDEEEVIRRIAEVAAVACDDGVEFRSETLRTVPIRADEEYHGIRLTMDVQISRAKLKLQLDISFGDPVTPAPAQIGYRQLLTEGTFPLLGYPIATVVAEKLTTAVELGAFNTRDRDWADLYRLTHRNLDGDEITAAVVATAGHRGVELRSLSSQVGDLAVTRQRSYTAWLRRQGAETAQLYPDKFSDVLTAVIEFADPLLAGDARGKVWEPEKGWVGA